MKQLNLTEVQQVSGAGVGPGMFDDLLVSIAYMAGAAVAVSLGAGLLIGYGYANYNQSRQE